MGDVSKTVAAQVPQVAFQSKDLEGLLNVIDELRLQGISRFIDLPQMIVTGDQSSGKSSVLEAVSGIPFPTKDNLCTRHPTELVLRRKTEISTVITIVPDIARSDEDKKKLQKFKAGAEALKDFDAVVEQAGKLMGLDSNAKAFCTDVLRVELTGPKLPHLTLVDLPGLFHSGSKAQSDRDAQAIKTLVMSYMQKPRSIILAVVSAKNDYANQIVTKYARDVDPKGERTLGIITKPDQLHEGSESEKQYIELAENKDVVLQLGWHVLRNRDYTTRNSSTAERDQAEADFFSKGVWTALKPGHLGIGALKPRLSRILKNHISKELPSLIKDVEAGIEECKGRLNLLGSSRATLLEQRMYLHRVSQEFSKIVQHGVAGYYSEEYFASDFTDDGYTKRIKAVVVNLLEDFADKMRTGGAQYCIVDKPVKARSSDLTPIEVTREQRLDTVAALVRRNRGQELSGFTRHETVTMLFREQCRPWEALIKDYAETIFDEVRKGVHLALDHTADPATKDGIFRLIIDPALEEIKLKLDEQVQRNLQQHLTGHPITFNHYFTDNVMKLRNEHQLGFLEKQLGAYFATYNYSHTIQNCSFNIQDLAKSLTNRTEADMEKFACSEALHYMEAYYKVALKFFVDDFGIHAVQQGLLDKLEGIFDPSKVFAFTDAEIENIAGESEDSRLERSSSNTKLAALKEALKILRQLDRARPRA